LSTCFRTCGVLVRALLPRFHLHGADPNPALHKRPPVSGARREHGPTHPPRSSGTSGWRCSARDQTPAADRARVLPYGRSTGWLGPRCDGPWRGGPFSVSVVAEADVSAPTARRSIPLVPYSKSSSGRWGCAQEPPSKWHLKVDKDLRSVLRAAASRLGSTSSIRTGLSARGASATFCTVMEHLSSSGRRQRRSASVASRAHQLSGCTIATRLSTPKGGYSFRQALDLRTASS
jgi:hypothetical protein